MLKKVENIYKEEEHSIISNKNWILFSKASSSLKNAAFNGAFPFDYKFNAVHWALDVDSLCREIVYSYCWMKAHALFYEETVKRFSEVEDVDFHVSYYADNCITRIDSCRDKLALMVWALYCPFNPEKKKETLNYEGIIERLLYPIKYALSIKNHDALLVQLKKLEGPDFNRIKLYRNLKIHRVEPRIEIYGVESHHGWDYMFPLLTEEEIRGCNKKWKEQYPDIKDIDSVSKCGYINGTPFERRRIENSIWDYSEVESHIKICIDKLLDATGKCFRILLSRSPLKSRKRS